MAEAANREKIIRPLTGLLILIAAFGVLYQPWRLGEREFFRLEGFYAAQALEMDFRLPMATAHGVAIRNAFPLYPMLVALLRENLQGEEFRIDHPRRTLEEFFLEVINRAKAESIETAGVVGGGKIAEYLSEEEKSNAVLDALMSESAASPVAAAEPAVVEEPIVAAEPTAPVLEEKLAELTGESAAAPESKTEEEAQKKQEELDAVNAKLDDLLSGRK